MSVVISRSHDAQAGYDERWRADLPSSEDCEAGPVSRPGTPRRLAAVAHAPEAAQGEGNHMRRAAALIGIGAASALATGLLTATTRPAPAEAAVVAPGVSAYFAMDELRGTTVMTDSGPAGVHAPVDPSGVTSGFTFDGATGYSWPRRAPEAYPPSPERIIQVPDHPGVEPGDGPFTIELRYRTQENFGNITQKGQAQTPGGQWKIQAPQGIPSCLFKGSAGQVATGAKTPLNDEQWHNLTCTLTETGVTMYVDGEQRNRKNGVTGTIDNDFPMTVGGKLDCDQVKVTCDYFSGEIDFIKITQAANLAPAAAWSSSCFGVSCAFDSSESADADGSLTRYLWEFGDGQTSTAANPTHSYAAPGTYDVRLTVTDNQAVTGRLRQTVTVEDAGPIESPIGFVDSAVTAGNSSNPGVTVPASATPGDRLLIVLSHNNLSRTVGNPAGWTRLDSITAGTMGTTAWTKVVAAGDPGSRVTVPLSGGSKFTLDVAAYTGTATTTAVPFASADFVAEATSRRTPLVNASLGDWVVSYWADKSSSTTAWTPASSVTGRSAACGADGGRICSLLADTGGPLPPGPYGDVLAITNAPSDYATMWSFVLRPNDGAPPVNQPPTAAFASDCTQLACGFDASGSDDLDGTIASYTWDFGDGAGSAEPDPTHTFPAAGSYDVRLTVTDDAGASDELVRRVTVQDAPAASPVEHVGSAATQASTKSPKVVVPAIAAGDRLVLALSLNNTTRTVSPPTGVTGWTKLDEVVAGDMRTVMWTKVATAGDAGTQVTVPLSGSAKHTLTVAAYRGVAPSPALTFARAVDTVKHAARTTPPVTVTEGAWVVSYWADKSSTTTSWTAPAVTGRQMICAHDSGRICSLLADSGGALPAGPRAGVSATTNAPSSKATTWSIVLAPAG